MLQSIACAKACRHSAPNFHCSFPALQCLAGGSRCSALFAALQGVDFSGDVRGVLCRDVPAGLKI